MRTRATPQPTPFALFNTEARRHHPPRITVTAGNATADAVGNATAATVSVVTITGTDDVTVTATAITGATATNADDDDDATTFSVTNTVAATGDVTATADADNATNDAAIHAPLLQSIAAGRVHSAYLFAGAGERPRAAAQNFARALACTGTDGDAHDDAGDGQAARAAFASHASHADAGADDGDNAHNADDASASDAGDGSRNLFGDGDARNATDNGSLNLFGSGDGDGRDSLFGGDADNGARHADADDRHGDAGDARNADGDGTASGDARARADANGDAGDDDGGDGHARAAAHADADGDARADATANADTNAATDTDATAVTTANTTTRPCEKCAACKRSAPADEIVELDGTGRSGPLLRHIGVHPDLLWVERGAGDTRVRIGQIRAVQNKFHLRGAHADGRRVAVIADAEWLNLEAQNALLRLLEEPPPRSTLLLVSAQPAGLLATVRSRTQRVNFPPARASSPLAATAAPAARELAARLGKIGACSAPELLNWAEEFRGPRATVAPALNTWLAQCSAWLHATTCEHAAAGADPRALLKAWDALQLGRKALSQRNANPQMVAERALFALREARA